MSSSTPPQGPPAEDIKQILRSSNASTDPLTQGQQVASSAQGQSVAGETPEPLVLTGEILWCLDLLRPVQATDAF